MPKRRETTAATDRLGRPVLPGSIVAVAVSTTGRHSNVALRLIQVTHVYLDDNTGKPYPENQPQISGWPVPMPKNTARRRTSHSLKNLLVITDVSIADIEAESTSTPSTSH